MRKNILIKISGDLVEKKETLQFIKAKTKDGYVVVVCGGGTAISEILKKENIESEFGPAGRIIPDFKGRQIARDILENRQTELQDRFNIAGINVLVEIPVVYIGGVLCHINGDDFLKSVVYNSYDELYCLTEKWKVKKKKEIFDKYPKIKVIGV